MASLNGVLVCRVPAEKHATLLADFAVLNAILCRNLHSAGCLKAVAESMAEAYVPLGTYTNSPRDAVGDPVLVFTRDKARAGQPCLLEPPVICEDGETLPTCMPHDLGRPAPAEGCSLTGWDSIRPADRFEAQRVGVAYKTRLTEWSAVFTETAFDSLLYGHSLSGDGNLLARASELREQIVLLRAGDEEGAREALAAVRDLLGDAEQLASDKDVQNWHAGWDSEGDVPYWRDVERFGQELEEARLARQAQLEPFLRAEREREQQFSECIRHHAGECPCLGGGVVTLCTETKEVAGEDESERVPLRIPGFVADVMDLHLGSAPYPNEKLAFATGLVLLAFLVSRKVRDSSDVRPNLYTLALASSGAGKEHGRKLMKLILKHVGLSMGIVENVASSQGLEDALQASPATLFLLDEADALLRAMSGSKDRSLIEIHSALLRLYSASSATYRMRIKAGEPAAVIDQPHLNLSGTAIPRHFFSALDERMLTNGLAGRMLVIDASGPRKGQPASVVAVPEEILKAALYWRDYEPPGNDLNVAFAEPTVVPATPEAEEHLRGFRVECDALYNAAAAEADRAIHARTAEMARKVALLYAVSVSYLSPGITVEAARWATAFARQQSYQKLKLIGRYGAASPFEQGCRRVLELLRAAPGNRIKRSALLRKLKIPAKQMGEWVGALVEREEIDIAIGRTSGRAATWYVLRSEQREERVKSK